MPPPFVVSMASNMETTSSISGRLSGLASQHLFITFARELGQHLGMSGLRFYHFNQNILLEWDISFATNAETIICEDGEDIIIPGEQQLQ